VDRRAFFVPVGHAPFSFVSSKLQLAPVTVAGGGWARLGLDQLFRTDAPSSTSIQLAGAGWSGSGIAWTATHLAVDGNFAATFAQK